MPTFKEIRFFDSAKTNVVATANALPILDGGNLYNVTPAGARFALAQADGESYAWDQAHAAITLTHGLSCTPLVTVFDAAGRQILPDVTVIDANTVQIGFGETVAIAADAPWLVAITALAPGDDAGAAEAARKTAAEFAAAAEAALAKAEAARAAAEAANASVLAHVSDFRVGPAYNVGLTVDGTRVSICWSDPADNLKDDLTTYAYWGKTRLVMKTGGFPENETDGITLTESTTRHQYRDAPFVWDAGVTSDYHFALFTCTKAGQWNCDANAPRFTSADTSLRTLLMMIRNGTATNFPGVEIGGILPFENTHLLYPAIRWRVVDMDYAGGNEYISQFHRDRERLHNLVLTPEYLPCLAGTTAAAYVQFDAPENTYARTAHTAFLTGYTYYTLDVATTTYVELEAGTDYTVGDIIADFAEPIYEKNHADRVSNGYNSWKESNIRQWLNASGMNYWQPQNIFDVQSGYSAMATGFLGGFDSDFRECIQPVWNHTARNTIAATNHGDGGGEDVTLDSVWLPGLTEFNGSKVNSRNDGAQWRYFKEIAVTNDERKMYDEGMTARNVWLRSANTSTIRSAYIVVTSGASSINYCSSGYAFVPVIVLA